LIADLQPGGRFLAVDLHRVGGVRSVLKSLLEGGHLHGDALTLSGRTLAEDLADVPLPDGQVVRQVTQAISPTGGVVVLKGNLAPEGALIKVAGLKSLKARRASLRTRRNASRRSRNKLMRRATSW
jgi:dihydroxy-acid dehydratase